MELESTNLIYIKNFSQLEYPPAFSYEKDIKIFNKYFLSTIGLINVFIILILFINFTFNRVKRFVNPLELNFLNGTSKDLLIYYQDQQYNFCDTINN